MLLLFLAPPASAAAAGDAAHGSGPVLCGLAFLVLAARGGGTVAERAGAPPVLGELIVGIVLANVVPLTAGATGIAFVRDDPVLRTLAQIGILILVFDVGLEADLRALGRVGWSSVLVALIGVGAPLVLGWGVARWLLPETPPAAHLFIGATLSATSVGVTARVLSDLGMIRSREGQIIIGAAILDDVLGLVLLAAVSGAVTSAAGAGATPAPLALGAILARAIAFLAATIGAAHLLSARILRLAVRTGPQTFHVVALALCFGLAFVAELLGLADIVGAFCAGLLLDPYGTGVRAGRNDASLSESLRPLLAVFTPLFFVLVGLQVDLSILTAPGTLALGGLLTVCAIAGKLASAFGVVTKGVDRLAVGFGMIPRGEVGLVFAAVGSRLVVDSEPVLGAGPFAAVVLMVVVTTALGPIGLRVILDDRHRARPSV